MKLKSIKIKNYQQLKNVEIDLTYPKGHRKAGKPLDKICILGKSGTGKTTLLRLIKWLISRDRSFAKDVDIPIDSKAEVSIDFELFDLDYRLINKGTDLIYYSFKRKGGKVSSNTTGKAFDRWQEDFSRHIKEISPLLINYPADLLATLQDSTGEKTNGMDALSPSNPESWQIIDFAFEDVNKTWDFILRDIKDHRARELLIKDKIVQSGTSMREIQKRDREYKEWLKKNPPPLDTLASRFLDPLLHKLGLKVKKDFSYQSIINLAFIELQSLTGEEVPRDLWSTGTRQQILTMLPLYQLKPKNAVILLDEPERSLYPDIQLTIADDYLKMTQDCQFFFATHSPFITASFEPWEIVELKFDKKNTYASRDLNYTGENHVDNYKYHPHYLRWDSNLLRIFDLDKEGGKFRKRALDKFADTNIRIRKLKEEGKFDSPEGQTLADEYLRLKELLDWRTT